MRPFKCTRAPSWVLAAIWTATCAVAAEPPRPLQPVGTSVTAISAPPRTVAQPAASPNNPASLALRVVLLLPLENSQLRRAAMSVRDGASAVFATKKTDVAVRECPYGNDGVVAAYQRCVDENVDWVVGPLGRNDVATLALATLSLLRPTLLLSPLGTIPPPPLVVLAPELEAEGEAIAQQAVEDACRAPLLLEASGTLSSLVSRVGISILSYWRDHKVTTPLQQKSLGLRESWRRDAERWRRDNVDCVLFAGTSAQLSELRPYLRGMAIYVTSVSHESALERTVDWTGVRIADAPWLIDVARADFAQYAHAELLSPTLARLYALGVDAARLVVSAGRDALPPTLDGAIGQLTLKDSQYRRQPMIGEFRERGLVKVGP